MRATPSPFTADDPSFVGAFARGLSVIRAFDARHEALSLADIARITGLPRATVRRSLVTLVVLGYAASDGKLFRLTPRILALGYAYLASTPLARVLQPALEEVSARTSESCSASTLDEGEIVYVARSATRRIMSVGLAVGSRLPAYCTSMGRVLLAAEPRERRHDVLARTALAPLTPRTITAPDALAAELDRVARQGFSVVDQELEIGLRSVAVPIRNVHGQVLAAMNVSVQAGRVCLDDLVSNVLPVLQAAARGVEPSLV